MGPGGFFPTNPDLADILGRTDLNFENCYVFVFFGSQISGFPGPQSSRFPEIWPGPGLARVGPGLGQRVVLAGVGNCSPAAPRQPRRTNLRRSKELGQDRENPISASPVWGKSGICHGTCCREHVAVQNSREHVGVNILP